jgi:hypothetical protein
MYRLGVSEPGWYQDPNGSGHPRWWDGERWWPVAPPSRAAGLGLAFFIVVMICAVVLVAAVSGIG